MVKFQDVQHQGGAMWDDITIISASIRNWWYNLHLDNEMFWIAIPLAIVVAVLVSKFLRPPKT